MLYVIREDNYRQQRTDCGRWSKKKQKESTVYMSVEQYLIATGDSWKRSLNARTYRSHTALGYTVSKFTSVSPDGKTRAVSNYQVIPLYGAGNREEAVVANLDNASLDGTNCLKLFTWPDESGHRNTALYSLTEKRFVG